MPKIPNVCRWWERHQWTKWTLTEAVSTNILFRTETECLVQTRRCERCGYSQIERVSGR